MKKALSLFSANLLVVLSMLLVITLGSLIQTANLAWGLIATEVFLIALPTLLFLRRGSVQFKEGLRLKRLPLLSGGLCVLVGIGLFFFGLLIEALMAQISGLQSVPIQASQLPKTGLEMGVYFVAMAVFAPLCEEIQFRGAVQGAYENRKPVGFAISITAIMFAFYHFRLSGLPALLPVAFVLSFVVWRTGSIYAGMLVHFGNNAAAALLTIYSLTNGRALPFINLWTMLGGLAAAGLLLLVIGRLHPRPEAPENIEVASEAVHSKPWLAAYWPLLIAGLMYMGVAGLTVVSSLAPQTASASEIQYGLPILSSTTHDHYVVLNEGGEGVGTMECALRPDGIQVRLDCIRTIKAFEYKKGNSFYKSDDQTATYGVTWDAKTMKLLSYSFEQEAAGGVQASSKVNAGKLTSTNPAGTQTVDLAEKSLVEFEWAWHAALLKANSGQSYRLPYAILMSWDESQKKSTPMVKNEILRVYNDEELTLIQGKLTVRKVTLGDQSAWYDREDGLKGLPRPVKFDDGMFVYLYTP